MPESLENIKLLRDYDEGKTNLFDVDKEFFIIDSEHLDDVNTRLYGYSIQIDGIYEQDNFTPEAAGKLDGCGTYVYVEHLNDEIRIRQDFNGSYGIYLFQHNDYYALSNSFFRLIEYIKYRYPLSLDRDFCNHIFLDELSSYAFSETPVNEVKLLEKDVIIHMDILTCRLNLEYIDYGENSLTLDSEEGIAALDGWFNKWIQILSSLSKQTDQISVNLSGGIDSRITFMLALNAALPMNKILVYSMQDNLHTHAEDLKIATEIGDFYGFKLNNTELSPEKINYTLTDIINAAFYIKMPFHKEIYYYRNRSRYVNKRYSIQGAGGESIRSYWNLSEQEFIEQNQKRCRRYSKQLGEEIADSSRIITERGYKKIKERFPLEDDDSATYPEILRRETRNRSHFGKATLEDYLSNTFILTPLIDPDLYRLKRTVPECNDHDLLITLIFERYCPQMLEFPIQGERSVKESTIQYAETINERFPFASSEVFGEIPNDKAQNIFHVVIEDNKAEQILNHGEENKEVPEGIPDKYLKAVFDSRSMKNLFTAYFDQELYDYAENNYETDPYYPLRECYPIIGISKVLEDILFSEQVQKKGIPESLDSFLFNTAIERDKSDISKENPSITLQELTQENMALKDKLKRITNERAALRNECNKSNSELEEIKNSTTFKVGKFIMAIPCAIKRKLTGE